MSTLEELRAIWIEAAEAADADARHLHSALKQAEVRAAAADAAFAAYIAERNKTKDNDK